MKTTMRLPFSMKCLLVLLLAGGVLLVYGRDAALARDAWKQEYEEVCGRTQNAMALTQDELQQYVARCDILEKRLDELNGTQGSARKVFARRLKMCRDLFVFALEYKKANE